MVIVLMGKSAVGKDTILGELTSAEFGFERVVSATTRSRRENEIDGKDYHFLSDKEFDKLIEEDGFIEHVEFNGVRYGCPKSSVDTDKNMCIVVETEGAKAFIEEYGRENIFAVYLNLDDNKRFQRASLRSPISKEEWEKRVQSDKERFKPEEITEIANFVIDTDDDVYVIAQVVSDAFDAYLSCPERITGEKCIVEEVYDEYGGYDSCKALSQTELDDRIRADEAIFEYLSKELEME